jgi:TPR repeat protein
MSVRLFALVSAVSLSVLATAAPAENPTGPSMNAGRFVASPGAFDVVNRNTSSCRHREFQCGVQAYDYSGPRTGVAWFRVAARQGSTPAMRALGLIYLHGAAGVPANRAEALGWFYEAALRDDRESMFALGRAFQDGVGVGRDTHLASFWIEQSATRGYAPARRALASLQQ